MISVAEIKKQAVLKGACDLINNVNSIEELVKLMLTPQGREFCKKNNFPSLAILRDLKAELSKFNVFVDAGTIALKNANNVVFAGDTHASLLYETTDQPYNLIVFEGATVEVIAKDFAVCQVTNIGGTVHPIQLYNANIYVR